MEAMQNMKFFKRQNGVTLVEMAVVVSLILIMVAIGTVVWNNMSDRALRNRVIYSTRDLGTAVKMYRAENGDYPPSGGDFSFIYPYTNVTAVTKDYQSLTLTIVSGSYACFSGILKNIPNTYEVGLCMETDDAAGAKYKSSNQPACCWNKTATCSSAANWYKCASKM